MSGNSQEIQLPKYTAPGYTLISIPYVPIFLVNVGIALGSFSTCITLGYVLHFEGVTATHCKVPNVVPSISAITGGFTPERYIWRYGMAYFSWPRTFDSFLIYGFFAASSLNKEQWYSILNKISWLCYVIEHVSLSTLTYVSSTENYAIHKHAFIFFVVCSIGHMVLSTYLFRHAHPELQNYNERMSWRLRLWSMIVFLLSLLLCTYFYIRHNLYCEPYISIASVNIW
ncbi:post-GPI attachment to proteins factor 2-like isoform X2 [Dysidea avara]|uniref:post-GPI attachment to proteins factor 2-like isoform X2 n=1 Tax=Dysidea avara TaxID=196820 RepID=UPI003327FD66